MSRLILGNTVGRRVVNGGGGYPAVIEDGNTVGWYLSDDTDNITKDASDFVSLWKDKLGSGNDLAQGTGANQPKWFETDGVLFDGDNDVLLGSFTYEQPELVYIVFKQITFNSLDIIFDGFSGLYTSSLYQFNPSPDLYANATNVTLGPNSNLPLDTFGIGRILFNGVNSKTQINQTTAITGDVGIGDFNGFSLGAHANGARPSNIQVKEIILRKIVDAAQDEQDIYDYLANKYSIS